MCELTNEGYIMPDKTVIPINEKLNLASISPKHIEMLNKSYSTQWDSLLLRQELHEVHEKLDHIIAGNKFHVCDPNDELINKIIEAKINAEPKRRFLQAFTILKYASFFVLFATQIYILAELILTK